MESLRNCDLFHLLPSVADKSSLPLRGRGTALAVERVSEVSRNKLYDCNGEGRIDLLPSSDFTIQRFVTPYLRHPLHRFAVPLSLGERLLKLIRSQQI